VVSIFLRGAAWSRGQRPGGPRPHPVRSAARPGRRLPRNIRATRRKGDPIGYRIIRTCHNFRVISGVGIRKILLCTTRTSGDSSSAHRHERAGVSSGRRQLIRLAGLRGVCAGTSSTWFLGVLCGAGGSRRPALLVHRRSMPGTSEVHGTVTAGGRPAVNDGSALCGCARAGDLVWAGQACCADAVRGCPCGPAIGSPRARTYSGQRRCSEHHPVLYAQVRHGVEGQAVAVCKTVGSAYVGSNPTPATTSEYAPLAANSRASRAFSLVPRCFILCRCSAPCKGSYGRIADGPGAEPAVRVTARSGTAGRIP
jgi:hypothetical protein